MISMYAEYSGRTLYVALSSDTIDGAKNGDTLYEMDTGKRYVCKDSGGVMNRWVEQPEEGGGVDYTEEDNKTIRIRNQTGTTFTSFTVYYSTSLGGLSAQDYSSLANNTNAARKVLLQDGWFTIRIITSAAHEVTNVTYGNAAVEYVARKINTTTTDLRIKLPDPYTSSTQIIIY